MFLKRIFIPYYGNELSLCMTGYNNLFITYISLLLVQGSFMKKVIRKYPVNYDHINSFSITWVL